MNDSRASYFQTRQIALAQYTCIADLFALWHNKTLKLLYGIVVLALFASASSILWYSIGILDSGDSLYCKPDLSEVCNCCWRNTWSCKFNPRCHIPVQPCRLTHWKNLALWGQSGVFCGYSIVLCGYYLNILRYFIGTQVDHPTKKSQIDLV